MGFGGHKNAAGLSLKLENIEEFEKSLEVFLDVFLSFSGASSLNS